MLPLERFLKELIFLPVTILVNFYWTQIIL